LNINRFPHTSIKSLDSTIVITYSINMVLKNSALFLAFLLLIFFNIVITLKINRQNNRINSTTQLLSEIEHARDTHKQFSIPSAPLVLGAYQAEIETGDARAANLRAFFRERNSPLYDEAEYIVKISDKYKMDYRLIPAISMQESNACKIIPPDSYNCWGWGIYGGKITKFDSFREAIDTVAQGLKEQYIDKGLVTPKQIMSKYTPSSNGSWAHGVSTVWGWFE
jgi:hypothetical protein